ncbi:MAG: RlmE family RNA methyltransferase [Deltaproteobacteria bacterium]|nr:RlmE family RNA methyltransferase [Deltaproteobacteria bacterium]
MKKLHDFYFLKAKKEGFLARSIYKLQEVQEKYHIMKSGDWVLDLGAAPGSWTQYASKIVGATGRVVAVDLQPIRCSGGNIITLQQDAFDPLPEGLLPAEGFQAILSDMAPKTSGHRELDHMRSMALVEQALNTAMRLLTREGTFFCKVFQGKDLPAFVEQCKKAFDVVKLIKPKGSRSESVEIFVLCSKKKEKGE